MIVGEVTIENQKLKLALAESRAEIRKLKETARAEGAGLGDALFGKLGGLGKDILGKLGLAGGMLGIADTIHSTMEEYGKLADMAARFNATPMSLQRLDMHAKLTGTSVESLVTGVQKLQRALSDPGDPKVVKALAELKLTAVDLAGLEPDQQLERIAEAFNEAQLSGRGFDTVFDLMGKSAGELIPALREFAENKARIADIKFLSDEDVRVIKEFGDQLTLIWATTKAGVANLAMHGTGNKPGGGAAAFMGMGGMLPRPDFGSGGADAGGPFSGLTDAFEKFTSPEQLKIWTARFKAAIDIQKSELAKQSADTDKIAAARKALADQEAAAALAGLTPLEQMALIKARILEKEKELAALQGPGADIEVQRLKIMQERARLTGEMAAKQQDQQRGEAEMAKLDRDAQMGGSKLFGSKADQRKALRDQLADSLGLKTVGSSKDVQDALKGLLTEAENQAAAGNFDAAKATYAKHRDALRNAGELASMGRERGGRPGEAATALSILTGGNQDRIVEETRNNGRLLDRILHALDPTEKGFGFNF